MQILLKSITKMIVFIYQNIELQTAQDVTLLLILSLLLKLREVKS